MCTLHILYYGHFNHTFIFNLSITLWHRFCIAPLKAILLFCSAFFSSFVSKLNLNQAEFNLYQCHVADDNNKNIQQVINQGETR